MEEARSRGRWAFRETVMAFAWAVGLVVVALVVPVYSSGSVFAPGTHTLSAQSLTLVGQNGSGVLLVVGLPALISASVWFALHRKCTRGGRASGVAAWTLIGLLGALCLVAIASIGLFIVPVCALLAHAARLTPTGSRLSAV